MFRVVERSQRLGHEAYIVAGSTVNTTLSKVSSVWSHTKEAFNAKFPKTGDKIYSIASAFNRAIGSLIGKVSSLYARLFPGRGNLRVGDNQPPVRENLAPPAVDQRGPAVDQRDVEIRALILSLLSSGENLTEDEITKVLTLHKEQMVNVCSKNYNAPKTEQLKIQSARVAVLNVIRERRILV